MPEPSLPLSPDNRRWLHDKLERLQAEEATLASVRTSYYAAIGTVLLTALFIAIEDFQNQARVLVLILTFLAILGIMISFVWIVLLRRTNDAKNLWREAGCQLERDQPPLEGTWTAPISLRSDASLPVNLLRPFLAHEERFSGSHAVSWMDRTNPDTLTEILPLTFLAIWIAVPVVAWVWFLLLR
ncbi:MAG: hypothetical protein L3K17_01835 [Thermoplasmata archaeon]|nr:hypothetical protein [Thermoplasmata archaeon]